MIIHDNFQSKMATSGGHHLPLETPWEICKPNFFSRTTGWIGTILGRNVPCKFLVKSTIDQNLVRNISAKYGSNPSSGS
jgi:hypothetical protein